MSSGGSSGEPGTGGVSASGGRTASSASGGATGAPIGSGGSTIQPPTSTGGATATGTGGSTTGSGGGGGATAGSGGRAGGGAGGAIVTGTGGAAPSFVPPFTCTIPTWPTPTGTPVSITGTRAISGVYDGNMALHDGSGSGDFGKDCNAAGTANQGTTSPLFNLADGATIQNVIIGQHGADGIHCQGTCTIKNVWFNFVCDDAVTAVSGSSGTVTIDGGGAKGAHDKLFQDNSHGKFVIQNFYGERLGKMYRACGVGGACGSTKGNVTITNTIAIGVDEIVGVTMGRDTATLSKICTFQSPTVCQPYDTSDNPLPTDGNDGVTCKYNFADVQVMLDHTQGVFTTGTECPNYFKSTSSTAAGTACNAALPACLKFCAPGDYGTKQCNCVNGTYSCKGCANPALDPAKSGLTPVKATTAPVCAVSTGACSTEWAWCTSGTQDCVCVYKPGTLQTANTVWDCVNPWF